MLDCWDINLLIFFVIRSLRIIFHWRIQEEGTPSAWIGTKGKTRIFLNNFFSSTLETTGRDTFLVSLLFRGKKIAPSIIKHQPFSSAKFVWLFINSLRPQVAGNCLITVTIVFHYYGMLDAWLCTEMVPTLFSTFLSYHRIILSSYQLRLHTTRNPRGGSKGGTRDAPLHFHAVFGQVGQIIGWRPDGLAHRLSKILDPPLNPLIFCGG